MPSAWPILQVRGGRTRAETKRINALFSGVASRIEGFHRSRIIVMFRISDRWFPNRTSRRRRGWLIAALATLLWTCGCAAPADVEALRHAVADNQNPSVPGPQALSKDDADLRQPDSTAPDGVAADGPAPDEPDSQAQAAGSAPCPGVRCVSIAVTGDVLLHPPLVEQARKDAAGTSRGLDFAPMLRGQLPYLATADLAVCHLETPLAPADGPFEGYPEFSVPPQILDALVTTGYDACTTASNHTMDQGFAGVVRTLDDLDAAGLAHDGSYRSAADAQTPTVIRTGPARIGLISVAYGLNTGPADEPWTVSLLDPAAIIDEAKRARAAGADVVVVAIHAGTEYETEPSSEQVAAAETLLADPAIDLVYGHHAHVVQPLQKIDGKWVIYGLGNMIASHETPIDATREGLLVRVTFSQGAAGAWTTSDVAWVPSLQNVAGGREWCSLTAGPICTSADADRIALARTTAAVNLLGADADGAQPLRLN